MSNDTGDSIRAKADAAFLQAAHKVVERAKQFNTHIIVWENGKIVERTWQEMEKEFPKKPDPAHGQ